VLRLICAFGFLFALAVMSGCRQRTSPVTAAPRTESGPAASPATTELGSIRPCSIVMYDSAREKQLEPYAQRIAKLIGATHVQVSPRNPVCCVWLELTGWTPNPGKRGYMINNQPGGSIIQASDEEQLKLAVERFESSAKRYADHVEVPTGLLTNYEVHPAPNVTEPSEAEDTSAESVRKPDSSSRSP
jgi:hypothetical protein